MHIQKEMNKLIRVVLLLALLSSLLAGCGRGSDDEAPAEAEVVSDDAVAEQAEGTATDEPPSDAQALAAEDATVQALVENLTAKASPIATVGTASEHEAPMLADQVSLGLLPPLEERLPLSPMVVEPIESIGEYGGTWRRVFRGETDVHVFSRITYETMLRWPRNPRDHIGPGIAEDWEWSADGTELTLHLREGMKWSDGAPFTTADITFWWDHIEHDENLTHSPAPEWIVDGEPMQMEAVDDYTLRMTFAAPDVLAEPVGLAFHGNQWPLGHEHFGFFVPRHYLEQFHPAFNPDATYELFNEMAVEFNIYRPVVTAWRITQWEPGSHELIAERNPYYWKVDTEGNQLPYIDRIHLELVADEDEANEFALSGLVDMQAVHMDYALIDLYEERSLHGGYHLGEWHHDSPSDLSFYPNQTYPDAQYRELMRNLDFRKALSISIDRELLNFEAYFGNAIIPTQNVSQQSYLYQPELDNGVMGYDPDAAMTFLDAAGLPVDEEGFRTFADGTPIVLVVETSRVAGTDRDLVEQVMVNWNDIGLRTELKTMSPDEFLPRANSNDVMIAVGSVEHGLAPMLNPVSMVPISNRAWMAPAYGTWYESGGNEGEAPDEAFQAVLDLYTEYRHNPSEAERDEIAKEIVRNAALELYTINTIGEHPEVVIINNHFENLIETDFTTNWIIMSPGTQEPSQFYFSHTE